MKNRALLVAVLVCLFALPVAWALPQENAANPPTPDRATMQAENERARQENVLIAEANQEINAKDWEKAEATGRQLIELDPARYAFYQTLGQIQYTRGKYQDAAATFGKGITLAEKTTDPKVDPAKKNAAMVAMLDLQGDSYLRLRQWRDAVTAYDKAAPLDPDAGRGYFNLCAVQYNTGDAEAAITSCRKAIAADPSRADAYFILGSVLLGDSKTDKEGKLVAPPGTAEALNKYLELAPNGPHANDVRQMLAVIGTKVKQSSRER